VTSDVHVPRNYAVVQARHGTAVVRDAEARGVAQILEHETLYAFAARFPGATRYQGRLPAYGLALPHTGTRVVVRHSTHGGMLARVTGDRFLTPGRAPHELRIAHALRDAGVPTPDFIGYASRRAGPWLCRTDVLSGEVRDAHDLAAALRDAPGDPRPVLEATARLIAALARAGARHADLNLKNVLVVRGARLTASVLDVDRVTMGVDPARAMTLNLARFERSARKWRTSERLPMSELDLRWLGARARELAA
jgi:tRNA A-37 threonylcarbamoyl transferase component Bud32